MPIIKNITYNKTYPLKIWVTTLLVGTGLHVLTSTQEHIRETHGSYFYELFLGTIYSSFTLVVSYIVFFLVTNTTLTFRSIKPIIALTGSVCCTATLMYKFNFNIDQIDKIEYLNLIAAYCLPLIASSFLLKLEEGQI